VVPHSIKDKLTFLGENTKIHSLEISNHPCGFVLPINPITMIKYQIKMVNSQSPEGYNLPIPRWVLQLA